MRGAKWAKENGYDLDLVSKAAFDYADYATSTRANAHRTRLDLTEAEFRELWSAFLEGHEDVKAKDQEAAERVYSKLAAIRSKL